MNRKIVTDRGDTVWIQSCALCEDKWNPVEQRDEPDKDWICDNCLQPTVDDPTSINIKFEDDDGYRGEAWAKEKAIIKIAFGIREPTDGLLFDERKIMDITIIKRRDTEEPEIRIHEYIQPKERTIGWNTTDE